MNERLTPAQKQTLEAMAVQVDRIAGLASPTALAATGVLHGAAQDSAAMTCFHRRFQQLAPVLRGLGARAVVSSALPPGTSANTRLTPGAAGTLLDVQVTAELLEPPSFTLPARTLTLVHELSHALEEQGGHPVKDYAYRRGWAWNYLTPELAADNADSYAEAAAQLGEQVEKRPGAFQATGRVPSQRDALYQAWQRTDLGAALAWVDLVVNRAWLRGLDSVVAAGQSFLAFTWPGKLKEWQADPYWAGLLRYEDALRDAGLIRGRCGTVQVGLEEADRRLIGRISSVLTLLKQSLDDLLVLPVSGGPADVAYSRAARTLTVPLEATGEGAVDLGRRVLSALITGLVPPPAPAATTTEPSAPSYVEHLETLVHCLVENDRGPELAALAPLFAAFADRRTPRPTVSQWTELALDLRRAELAGTAALWRVVAADAFLLADLPAERRGALATLHESLDADLEQAVAIGRLGLNTREEFQSLIAAQGMLASAVLHVHPELMPRYRAFRDRLTPFAA